MSKQDIDFVDPADDLPTGAAKINANFGEVYLFLGDGTDLEAGAARTSLGLATADSPTFTGLTLSGLTSGRVAIIGASGVITHDAGLLYDATTDFLTAGALIPSGTTKPTKGFYIGAASTVSYSNDGATEHFRFSNARSLDNTSEGLQISGGIFLGGSTTLIGRAANNSLYFNGGNAGGNSVSTRVEINKAVTAFTDAVAKATFTVTIPNGAHSAALQVQLTGSIGAGGAIGANEATGTISYDIAICRTAGVNATAVISAAYGSQVTAVAGATTITVAVAVSAISGAVGATNTFTVDVTITKGGGSSDNHTCLCYGKLMNANASGATIA